MSVRQRLIPQLPREAWVVLALLVAGGADPVAVRRHLGHKDVSTTLNITPGCSRTGWKR